MADELRFVEEFPVTPAWLHQQLPVALSRARFGGLTQGVLPLGRWAFGNPGAEPPEDPVTVLIVALFGIAALYRTLGTYDTTVQQRVAQ